jgi:hypothetical protein
LNINATSKYGVIYLGEKEAWRMPLPAVQPEELTALGMASGWGSRLPKPCDAAN